jgi:hypothetical protein
VGRVRAGADEPAGAGHLGDEQEKRLISEAEVAEVYAAFASRRARPSSGGRCCARSAASAMPLRGWVSCFRPPPPLGAASARAAAAFAVASQGPGSTGNADPSAVISSPVSDWPWVYIYRSKDRP